jgi:hypothetical protein
MAMTGEETTVQSPAGFSHGLSLTQVRPHAVTGVYGLGSGRTISVGVGQIRPLVSGAHLPLETFGRRSQPGTAISMWEKLRVVGEEKVVPTGPESGTSVIDWGKLSIIGEAERVTYAYTPHWPEGGVWTLTQQLHDAWGPRTLTVALPQGGSPNVNSMIEELRRLSQLPVTRVADLLKVSRRRIYDWMGGERISPANLERLVELKASVETLADRLRPGQIRSWFESGEPSARELLQRGAWDEFRNRVADVVAPETSPLISTRRLAPEETIEEEVRPLEREEQLLALAAFRRERPANVMKERQIKEFLDSTTPDEE